MKAYALEVIKNNIENFNEEMEYMRISFQCNKGFIGINVDTHSPDLRVFALFETPKARNECYNRINNHYKGNKPRVAIVIESCEIDDKYVNKD